MSWVTVVWSMIVAVCLTLAGLHLLIWGRRRGAWGNLLFSASAIATAALAACELWMMRAATPAEFGLALRWLHVPAWVVVVSLVWLVRVYLGAGRSWLAWAACEMRTLSLVLNFVMAPNLNYREITSLRHVWFLGEPVAVTEGVSNPWMLIGQISLVLMVVFVANATITVWRRGERRRSLLIGASILFFFLLGTGQAVLVIWGILLVPITASLFYLGIIVTMGWELSHDVFRAADLARELGENQKRMSLAAEAAQLGVWVRDLERNEIWASEQWRVLFGFPPAERLELPGILQRMHPEDRASVGQTLASAEERGGGYETEYRVLLPDGQERWIASRGRVECNDDGKAAIVRGISHDITARKRAEVEMQLLRQEIAHVGRVTMMGQLASALAHEINQPLGAILRNAEAAELFMQHASPDLEEIRAILTDIRKDDQRASAVIDRMRALLKRRDLETSPIDARELIGDVVSLTRADASSRQVKLEVDVTLDLPLLRADRVHLQQVLLNLVVNGMEALNDAAHEDRRVSIGARRDGERDVLIAVSDTGMSHIGFRCALSEAPRQQTTPDKTN